MESAHLKKLYGDEYPAVVIVNGIRMGLRRESRFSRGYDSDDRKNGCEVSRFMDGSASIEALELKREWADWTQEERADFCQSCCWLDEQPDFPEMLRFIIQHGEPEHWSGIALSVASKLPRDEAFNTLVLALQRTDIGKSSNIAQAIAYTGHPNAEVTLRSHLAIIWSHPDLWKNADFINWIGFDATNCIADLIKLGALPSDFTDQVHRLSDHVCSRNRESCRNFLSKHYSWLKS
jgi:hypothetical protein